MKFYKCVNEVKPSYVTGTEPQFSETVICDNSSKSSTLTLTQDYHNFDIIKFKTENISSQAVNYFYATPKMLDADKTYSGAGFNLNEVGGNQYVYYQVVSNTSFTRVYSRNTVCVEVLGLKCINGNLVETEIYNRGNINNTPITITTELNLLDFNLILIQSTNGRSDESNIQDIIYIKSNNKIYGVENPPIKNNSNILHYTCYNNASYQTAMFHEHSIDIGYWLYVTGLKFIPKWDYYIENLIFNGTSATVIDTELPIFSEANKDRDFEIEFKDNETRRVNENWYPYFSVFDNSYIYYEYIAFLGTSMGRFASLTDYQVIKNESPQSVIGGTEAAALGNGKTVRIVKQGNKFTVYYDNSLVQTRTFSNGMPSTDANLKLGIGKNGSTTYYGNQNSGFKYFGFRWLS